MWWKVPLLALLSLPLGWKAWDAFDQYRAHQTPPPPVPPPERLSECKQQLKKVREGIEERKLAPEMVSLLVCCTTPWPKDGTLVSAADQQLKDATRQHSDAVGEVLAFFKTVRLLKGNPDMQVSSTDEKLADLLRSYKTRLALEAQIRKLLAGYPGSKGEVEAQLEGYSLSHPWFVKDFVEPCRATMASKDISAGALQGLEALVRHALVERAAPTSLGEARSKAAQAIRELGGFLLTYPGVQDLSTPPRDLSAWARAQKEQAELWHTLLTIAEADETMKDRTGKEVQTHLAGYARILGTPSLPAETRSLVRETALRFCTRYLPRRLEPENKILFGGNQEVDPDEVMVEWKDRTPQRVALKELKLQGIDENNPPDMKEVLYYFTRKPSRTSTVQIAPTDRNRVAAYYNERRGKVVWTEEYLLQMREGFPVGRSRLSEPDNKEVLGLYERIETLVFAARESPALFEPPSK